MTTFNSYNFVATKRQGEIVHDLLSRKRSNDWMLRRLRKPWYAEEQARRNRSESSGVAGNLGGIYDLVGPKCTYSSMVGDVVQLFDDHSTCQRALRASEIRYLHQVVSYGTLHPLQLKSVRLIGTGPTGDKLVLVC